jgi:hypothetical protein
MGEWDETGSWEIDGVDSVGLGQGLLAGSCGYGDEPCGSGATELITLTRGHLPLSGIRVASACTVKAGTQSSVYIHRR